MNCEFSKATGECLRHGSDCEGEGYPIEFQRSSTSGVVLASKEDSQSPWEITYPWGADSFYGTREEVEEEVSRRIREASGDYS